MSKTVIIPDNMHPWSCEINGVKYGPYPAGTEQTVPDEVAAVIDNYYASLPVETPPETDEEEITRIATPIAQTEAAKAAAGVLPAVTGADNGKLFGVSEGAWGKVDAPKELPAVTGADNGKLLGVTEGAWGKVDSKLIVNYTLGETVTCDKTYAEILAAYNAGMTIEARTTGGDMPNARTNSMAASNTGISFPVPFIYPSGTVGIMGQINHLANGTILWWLKTFDINDIGD